jgi:hypothetical protein
MTLIERWTITPAHHEDDDEGDCYTVGACIEPPLTFGSEPVEVVRADAYRGAVDLLRDVATSGVSYDESRVRYVEVQIDRDTWEALAAYRERGQ